MKLRPVFLCFLFCVSCTSSRSPDAVDLGGRKVIGYWHSWRSRTSPYIPLADVPSYVNQVNVAFAFPESATSNRLVFPHPKASDREMRAQIRGLQRRGIQVFLSLGGGNHPIELKSARDRDQFVASLIGLVNRYGFDGVDINLEGASTVLDPGDLDFRNPTTPKIRYFIQAIQAVDRFYQGRVLLSVAPETQFVFGGYAKYGREFGGYLPILHALRDQLDLVHVQLYNSGSQFVYTGDPRVPPTLTVERGTAEFVVALTEMMILGFPVANDPQAFFEGFPPEKVVVGLPSTPSELGNGTLDSDEFRDAMRWLLTGRAPRQSPFRMRSRGGYPRLRGVMTWSLNWDARRERGRRPYDFVQTAGEVMEEVLSSRKSGSLHE